jgi:hypothetical protein
VDERMQRFAEQANTVTVGSVFGAQAIDTQNQ